MEKMRAYSKSDCHIKHCEAELLAARARKEGSSIGQQLQIIGEQERIKNRSGIRVLLLCTHFLARQHIPHTTNFDQLVDLVVSCGGEDLKHFLIGQEEMLPTHQQMLYFISLRQSVHGLMNFN